MAIDGFRRNNRTAGTVLKPDMKSEVILTCGPDGEVEDIDKLVLALSHTDGIDADGIRELVSDEVAAELAKYGLSYDMRKAIINATGKFVVAGPMGDTGVTGRKLALPYGPGVPIGGGAFHGKDPSKADAVAALMGRWAAKQIVGNGLADQCLIRIPWVIGQAEPLRVSFDTAGTEKVPLDQIKKLLGTVDWSMGAAIDRLGVRRINQSGIVYPDLAKWGTFGNIRDTSARPWETVVDPAEWKHWQT